MRPIQEPTVTTERGPGIPREVTRHPAFGQISAHRVQGAANLYGSDFTHHNFVQIEIMHSELNRDLSTDWHFARKQIVQLAVSEAQWATFVSSLNVGGGVPCTLEYLPGEAVPRLPERKSYHLYSDEAAGKVDSAVKALERLRAKIVDESSKLPKRAQAELLEPIDKAIRELSSNMTFVKKQFDEHVEGMVEKAKVEVNAYATNLMMRAGVAALQGGAEPPVQIGSRPDAD